MQCEIETGDVGVHKNAEEDTAGAPVTVAFLSFQWPASSPRERPASLTMGVIFPLLLSSFAYVNALVI